MLFTEGVTPGNPEKLQVKDRHNRFRSIDENIWNNPNRTSGKMHQFYHKQDLHYKSKYLV